MNLTRLLPMTLTQWGDPTPDAYGGATFSAPATFKGRWEDRQDIFINAQGREERSTAVAYAETDFVLGGYLYNGTSTASDPATVEGAKEIRAIAKIPSVKGTQYLRKAWL